MRNKNTMRRDQDDLHEKNRLYEKEGGQGYKTFKVRAENKLDVKWYR